MPKAIFAPAENTFISQYYPLKNFNGSATLFIGQYKQAGDTYRSLLKFDLNQLSTGGDLLPSSSRINEAYLQLSIKRNEVPKGSVVLLNVFSVVQPWTPGAVSWHQQPLIHAVAESSTTIAPGYGRVEFNLTSLVRDWLAGLTHNHGILMIGDESRNSLIAFYSSFSRDSSLWPRLTINYTSC